MRGVVLILMLIGIGVILTTMWVVFPSMWIGNIIVTAGLAVWAVWISKDL